MEEKQLKQTDLLNAIHFLLGEIENIITDGDEFDFDKAREILFPLGINIDDGYFQP